MGIFSIQGSEQALFGGRFYGQLTCEATRDPKKNTYSIQVTGISAYSQYGWDFNVFCDITLTHPSSGQTDSIYNVKIERSGSSSYKGWLPKSGDLPVSVQLLNIRGNSDGTCPEIFLYFKFHSSGISTSSGIVNATSEFNGNIANRILVESNGPNDRQKPVINNFTATPGTVTTSNAVINVDCDSIYSIIRLETGEELISGKVKKNVDSYISMPAIEGVNTYYLYVTKEDNHLTSWAQQTVDTSRPKVEGFSAVPHSTTQVKVNFTSNYPFSWKFASDQKFTGSFAPGTIVTAFVSLREGETNVQVQVKRTDAGNIVSNISSTEVDLRIPSITGNITPTAVDRGILKVSSNFPGTANFYGPSGELLSSLEINTAGTTVSGSVPLLSNTHKTYSLTFIRDYSDVLSNTMLLEADTRVIPINITDVTTAGNTVKISASIDDSWPEVQGTNWTYMLKNDQYTINITEIASELPTRNIQHTVTNVPMDRDLDVYVYVTNPNNNLVTEVQYVCKVRCSGVVYVCTGISSEGRPIWTPTTVYQCKDVTTKSWPGGALYVCTGINSDNKAIWKYGNML